jgi:hypothetical protein
MVESFSVNTRPIIRDLQDRDFAVSDDNPAVVRGDATAFVGIDAPLEVVPLANDRPLTVISAISTAVDSGRVPILAVDQDCHDTVREFLSTPFGLAGLQNGTKRFYATEGRIQLADGSYACVPTGGPLSWTEGPERESAEPRQLQLMANDEPIATIESAGAIACPAPQPDQFQYRYGRNEDGQFVVYSGTEPVGTYAGVSAMRADGIQPIPAPLIPEQYIASNPQLARATVLAAVVDGSIQYVTDSATTPEN